MYTYHIYTYIWIIRRGCHKKQPRTRVGPVVRHQIGLWWRRLWRLHRDRGHVSGRCRGAPRSTWAQDGRGKRGRLVAGHSTHPMRNFSHEKILKLIGWLLVSIFFVITMAISETQIWRYRPFFWWAYYSGLKFQGISPQNMAKNMVLTYLHVLDPEDLPLK